MFRFVAFVRIFSYQLLVSALLSSALFLSCSHDAGGGDVSVFGLGGGWDFDGAICSVNPLKGFVSWGEPSKNGEICSLEYVPVPFDKIVTSESNASWNWRYLENELNEAKSRRHQAIVRVVIDNTGHELQLCLPDFIKSKITMYHYNYEANGDSPDYNDEDLLNPILEFISEFGRRYDGDSRIACIQTGIIGHWGEQHIYYCEKTSGNNQKISESTYEKIFKAFSDSFSTTQISARTAEKPGVANYDKIGFYHDVFYDDDGDKDFRKRFQKTANPSAVWARLATTMITGEFAPASQLAFLKDSGNLVALAKYKALASEFHVSSLLCNNSFDNNLDKNWLTYTSSLLGYDFNMLSATASANGSSLSVSVRIKNQGVAKFFYKWPVFIALCKNGNLVSGTKTSTDWDITTIAPGEEKSFSFSKTFSGLSGSYSVLLGIPNKMDGGYPVQFSNTSQNKDVQGWITLGSVSF